MSDIKIRLRFYLPHDMDLISLMITHEMDIVQAMYCAISAFVKHDSFAIKIPPLRDIPMEKKRVFHRNLSLDPKKDAEVIALLECIEPGYRNNFLKNILRLYLFCPATEAFLVDKNKMDSLESYYESFRKGKRMADAASLRTKRKHTPSKSAKEVTLPHKSNDVDPLKQVEKENLKVAIKEDVTFNITETMEADEYANSEPNGMEEDLTDLFTGLLG